MFADSSFNANTILAKWQFYSFFSDTTTDKAREVRRVINDNNFLFFEFIGDNLFHYIYILYCYIYMLSLSLYII